MTGKPTEGKWVLKEWGDSTKVQALERAPTFPIVREVAIFIGGQQKENAMLTQEAGTVYHETGLTPRQLAEQRDELLAMLDVMCDKFEGRMGDWEIAKLEAMDIVIPE